MEVTNDCSCILLIVMRWQYILFGCTKLASLTCIFPQEVAWKWACYHLVLSPFSHQQASRDFMLQPWHISWERPHIWMTNLKKEKWLIPHAARGKSASWLLAHPIYPYIAYLRVKWWLRTSEQKAGQLWESVGHTTITEDALSSSKFVRCGAIKRLVV